MLSILLTAWLLAQSPTVPITVLSSSVDLVEETVTFTVRNDSNKAITYWNASITVAAEPDNMRRGWGVDAYRSFAGVLKDGFCIPPKGTVTVTVRFWEELRKKQFIFPTATITPTTAIFADTTFAGDERDAKWVLDRRARHAADWRRVLGLLEQAKSEGPLGVETFEFLRDRLDALVAKDEHAIVPKQVGMNVRIFINQVREGTYSAEQRLDFLLDQARRELAAAVAHSRQ